jgi:hypothetical protein
MGRVEGEGHQVSSQYLGSRVVQIVAEAQLLPEFVFTVEFGKDEWTQNHGPAPLNQVPKPPDPRADNQETNTGASSLRISGSLTQSPAAPSAPTVVGRGPFIPTIAPMPRYSIGESLWRTLSFNCQLHIKSVQPINSARSEWSTANGVTPMTNVSQFTASFAPEQVIHVKVEGNPKKPMGKSYARFALYEDGLTVAQYVQRSVDAGNKASLAHADLRWDAARKFIEVGSKSTEVESEPTEKVKPAKTKPPAKAKKVSKKAA